MDKSNPRGLAQILPSRTAPEVILVEDDSDSTYREMSESQLASMEKVVVGRVMDLDDVPDDRLTKSMLLAWMNIVERGLFAREKDKAEGVQFAPANEGARTIISLTETFCEKHKKMSKELQRKVKGERAWQCVNDGTNKKGMLHINSLADVRLLLKKIRRFPPTKERGSQSCLEHLTEMPF